MNNTRRRTLAIVVLIFTAATLVVGTAGSLATKTAFAANNNSGNTVTIEECKNRGSASGFDTAVDQECENLICTHPANGASCVSENEAATTTTSSVTTGTLIVKKLVECRIGITCTSPSDFTIKVTGNHPTPSTFQVTSESGTVVTLGVGAYKVSEEPFQGSEPSFSADCEGIIAPGDQKTCTITNSQSSAG
jgi:hypothetical protein